VDEERQDPLQQLAQTARIVFFAGLPGTGKSFFIRRLAEFADAAGRRISLLQWDVVRPVFETSPAGRRYPMEDGVTQPMIRKAVGVWVRRAVMGWHELHPTAEQQRLLYRWLVDRPGVLTGDSFFHLSALGEALPGLNLCGAGRVVCLIDPVGDVYACPFVLHHEFRAGNVREPGGFARVWRSSDLFLDLRRPGSAGACASCGSFDACQGGCMAAKFFTGLPLDGPDPECVRGYGELALAGVAPGTAPSPGIGHSVPVTLGRRPAAN